MEEEVALADEAEYPGVRWVKANYILLFLEDGKPMPRCQDLPPKAFGTIDKAVRVFGVTHPWLGRFHPDPQGIQMETLRAKLKKLKKQMMLDQEDVVFLDYMSLPQVTTAGVDDRTPVEKQRLAAALSGDLMGRIYLTTRVIIIDEVPNDAESRTAYLDRGWCYFECIMTAINTSPRDLAWVDKSVKDEIARFREMSAAFRQSGDIAPLAKAFDQALPSKMFANPADRDLVRGFFASLATSQRLVAAAARGDVEGALSALEDGADPRSRNGQGRTALQAAALNGRVAVLAALLRRVDRSVAAMKTMENESTLDAAREGASRECQVLLRHKLGEAFPALIVRTIEGDAEAVQLLIAGGASPPSSPSAPLGLAPAASERAAPGSLQKGSGSGQAPAASAARTDADKAQAPAPREPPRATPPEGPAAGRAKGGAARSGTPAGRPRQSSLPSAKAVPARAAKAKAGPPVRGTAMRSAARLVLEPASPTPPPAAGPELVPAGPAAPAAAAPEAPPAGREQPKPRGAEQHPSLPGGGPALVGPDGMKAGPADVRVEDDAGNTALHYAVSLQLVPIVAALVQARADVEFCNRDGDSPLAMATRAGSAKVLAALGQA
mmetsp:Transcript_90615/g.280226  ORF Transcript_90615/g.280226 Transcript_90615/m.280226 type:complete len:609 (+) Transcript_90615:84-1910(+)